MLTRDFLRVSWSPVELFDPASRSLITLARSFVRLSSLQARKIVSNRPHPGTPHTRGGPSQRFLMEVEKMGDYLSERLKGSRAYVDLSREHTWMTR